MSKIKNRQFIVTGEEQGIPVRLAFSSYKLALAAAKKLHKGEVFDTVERKTLYPS